MPANLCFHLPESLFSAYQRKSITGRRGAWIAGMCSLSQKLFQGIYDWTDDIPCQHIPFILCINEFSSSKFHSISLETFKSGDTAETVPRQMMFIAQRAFQHIIHKAILESIVCEREREIFPSLEYQIHLISLHYHYTSIHSELNPWLWYFTQYYSAAPHLPWQLPSATQAQSTHITSLQASSKCDW